ncbi:MAG: hypothetical protein AAB579_00220 [Patescibacteria group bacterium]
MDISRVIPIFVLATLSFFIAMLWAPGLAKFLHRGKFWKKQARTEGVDGQKIALFTKLHKERETSTPRMAGVLIWVTTAVFALGFFFLAEFVPHPFIQRLNFLSRAQTWLPLFTLIAGSLIGLADDILVVRGGGRVEQGGGIRFRHRLLMILVIALIGAWWFFGKLDADSIHIPFIGELIIGWWYVPLFIVVMFALFSSSIVDGLDGLAGGVFAILFGVFGAIAFAHQQYHIAAFCAVIAGSLLAFLWFNVPPAVFYMGETGILGLTTTLAVVAFITDAVLLLPIVGLVLWIEAGSVILQMFWKRFLGRKLFLIAPFHHHLEAKGWPAHTVTMRFWMVAGVSAAIGLIIALADPTFTSRL